jgi:hypothetical protein
MSVKEVIQIESETATGEPVRIPFEFADKSSIPEGKNPGDCIIIKPITLRTWFKLKPLLVMIEQKDIDLLTAKEGVEFDSETAKVIFKYSELLFEIVCLGIRNRKGEMPEWFKDVLKDNCTWHDIYILLNAILFRIRFNSFSSSIILAKSVSPQSEEEIIALQENKMTWSPNQPSCS